MFGTSGIRGVYGTEITPELATRVSAVFAEGLLAVGRDIRESGPALSAAVARGALQAGAEVIDCGVLPTPTLALATRKHGCRGIMVTASHNPQEYNGLKLVMGGKEISKGMEKEVERKYREYQAREGAGGGIYRDSSMVGEHMALAYGLVESGLIGRKKPKVIVDCNGAGCAITPYLLSALGCRVVSVNSSEHCFNRQSEPREENLSYLGGLVRDSGADFALAHDGDGDRCVIIDERGQMLPLDVQLAIMIEHEMRKGTGVISTVEASLTVREVVEKAGGRIEITPVGSTYVGDRMEEGNAVFGGEPCGEYIYREGVHVPDAVLAAAKFAEIFCQRGAFSELRKGYRQNHMAREKFPAKDKVAAMEKIKQEIRVEGRASTGDGIRIDEEDGWFLIRASGTEPIIRLTLEYSGGDKAEKRRKELSELIGRFTS